MKEKMQTGLRGSPAQKPVFTASNNPACQNRTSYGMTVKESTDFTGVPYRNDNWARFYKVAGHGVLC